MVGFHFRLSTLLRLRERERDDRRRDLAEAYRVDEVLHRQADEVEGRIADGRGLSRRAAGPGTVDVDRLLEAQRYDVTLHAELARLQQQRQAVAAEIERRHQNLVEANREVRVLEKLRERQAERFRDEENRRQIKQLDETAQVRALRQEGE